VSLFGRTVVYDMHENVPATITSRSWIPGALRGVLLQTWKLLERVILRRVPVIFAEQSYAGHYEWVPTSQVILNLPLVGDLLAVPREPHERFTIGYVGRVSEHRGSGVALEAVAQLRRDGIEVEFECVGQASDAHAAALRQRAAELGVTSAVRFTGPLPPPEAWARIARCQVGVALLAPIPNYLESYPTKMFEYMALGLPVVVSNFPLYRGIVEEHAAGLCVDPLEPAAVADAVRRLMSDPREAQAMGRRGRDAVIAKYGWESEREKLFAFYRRLGVEL
jgi:glycosyltransferase involved in cell wall biosynthesis